MLAEGNALGPTVHTFGIMGATKRTTIRVTDERKQLIQEAKEIVAARPSDDPPTSDVIDAALTHLVESKANLEEAGDVLDPATMQRFNTSVIGLEYQASVDSRWR